MRLKSFGLAVVLLSCTLLARADALYTVSFAFAGDSGTYTFVEPSILTSAFTVNASDLLSSVESGDVLTSIFINPTDSASGNCFFGASSACAALSFTPPGGAGLLALFPQFAAPLTSAGVYVAGDGTETSVSIEPYSAAAAPEPSSLALLGTGVLGFAGVVRKRLRGR